MCLVLSCICLCPIHWSQMLSREWRCRWSSAERRSSNYIWVISKFIAHWGASYITGLTVCDVYFWCVVYISVKFHFNTLLPRWNSRHFPDNIFKCVVLNENVSIWIKISLKLVPKGTINSFRPSDAIWRHRSGSTLAQVMASCLTAPSHYLSQCWLIISKIQWHSSEGNFVRGTYLSPHYLKLVGRRSC